MQEPEAPVIFQQLIQLGRDEKTDWCRTKDLKSLKACVWILALSYRLMIFDKLLNFANPQCLHL